MDLIDSSRNLHPILRGEKQNTHSFQAHMEHFPGQTTSSDTKQSSTNLGRQNISRIFSDYNSVKLEVNHRKKNRGKKITCMLKKRCYKKVSDKIKEIRKYLKTNYNENMA